MLNYRVEFDEQTKELKVIFLDEEGYEIEPEPGVYQITIPKNTFVWYGDAISCEGKEGNDEYIYTYTVSGGAPKPEIKPYIKDGFIYFIVENGSNSTNYNELGYKTKCDITDLTPYFKAVEHFGIESITFIPDGNVEQFGYDENKPYFLCRIEDNFQFEPDYEYALYMLNDVVYNQGWGTPYGYDRVYNETEYISFKTPVRPIVDIVNMSYDYDTSIITLDLSLENIVYNTDENLKQYGFTTIMGENKPYAVNNSDTYSAFTKTVEWSEENPKQMRVTLFVKNVDMFSITKADGSKIFNFNIIIPEGYLQNRGDQTTLIGKINSLIDTDSFFVKNLLPVPAPTIYIETRTDNGITTHWKYIYERGFVTTSNGQIEFVANYKDGRIEDISSYITYTEDGNDISVIYDTETNFGVDASMVSSYELVFKPGFYKNEGDNKMYSGTEKSKRFSYTYKPIDCQPKANLVKTNVNAFYPIVEGPLETSHDWESISVKSAAITVTDENDKLLMSNISKADFDRIQTSDIEGYQQMNVLIEDRNDIGVELYSEDEVGLYNLGAVYDKNGAYENYHGHIISINIDADKIENKGDGYVTLGKLKGTTDTPTTTRYVCEFSLFNDTHDTSKTITQNLYGGLFDINDDFYEHYFSGYTKPYIAGCYGQGGNPIITDGDALELYKLRCGYNPYDSFKDTSDFMSPCNSVLSYYTAKNNLDVQESADGYMISLSSNTGEEMAKVWLDWVDNFFETHENTLISGDGAYVYQYQFGNYYDLTDEQKDEVFEHYKNWFSGQSVNNLISFCGIKTNADNTYSCLYTKPSKHFTFGSAYKAYNDSYYNAKNSLPIKEIIKIDTSRQKDFSCMFCNQTGLHKISAEFNMDSATALVETFLGCWNVKAEDNEESFKGEINTESDLNNVISANSAFCNCTTLSAVPETFEMKNLKDGQYMFYNTPLLNRLPLSFNPTGLVIADYLLGTYQQFSNFCNYYRKDDTTVRVGQSNQFECKYYDVTKDAFSRTMQYPDDEYIEVVPFEDIYCISSINNTWKSVSTIKSAEGMCMGRTKLQSVPMNWNFSSLENGAYLFADCCSLKQVPTAWITTNNLVNADYMFMECSSLSGIHNGFECRNLSSAKGMFSQCSFSAINDDFAPNSLVYSDYMFNNCSNLQRIPTGFTTIENILTSRAMLHGCSSITALPTTWTTCISQDIQSMFEDTSLSEINMDFSRAMYADNAFNATTLQKINGEVDLSDWIMPIEAGRSIFNENGESNCYHFRLKGIGSVENYNYATKTTDIRRSFSSVYFNLNSWSNSFSSFTELQRIDFCDSVLYMFDNICTGQTKGNISSKCVDGREYTHNRASGSLEVLFLITPTFWSEIKPYITSRLQIGSHEQWTIDIVNGTENTPHTGWGDYKITNGLN